MIIIAFTGSFVATAADVTVTNHIVLNIQILLIKLVSIKESNYYK
jgi:hypothetical protein